MRHPADSIAWKTFDELHQSFVVESRNVRLGLATDGFQPFGNFKTPYSIWPVVLIPYNLPPWLCMKKENFILSMLIPGPESLGDAIDVYLQSLIEELKELWKTGVESFDASARKNIMLHVALLWTINDFSAYANLSGWSTKGLKSHDCHITTILAPLAIRGMLCKSVSEPLIELSLFFNILGAKCLSMEELEQIDGQIPKTECKLEKHMYPMQRYIYFMKSLVGNRACPEGSIAEGYLATECLTLCSRYLHTMETKFNRLEWNCDGGVVECDGGLTIFFCESGRALRGGKQYRFDSYEFEQAHIYILKNCDEVQPFLEEFSQNPAINSQETLDRQFISWLKEKVAGLHKHDDSKKMIDLVSLSRGPTPYVTSFHGYVVNGYRFHVQDYDKDLRTQNCRVVVVGETDKENKNINYYGELTEILELQFVGSRRVILFRCKWFDIYDQEKGVKVVEYGIVSVNRQRFLKINEPFVLANQALQVFYADDLSNKGWHVVQKVQPHDFVDIMKKEDVVGNNCEELWGYFYNPNIVEMNPSKSQKFKMESTSKTVKHSFVALGALARGRGQNFRTLGSVRVNAEQRLPIGKSKNCNAQASYLNELAQNRSLAPPGFDPLEDDVSLPQEVEVMQDTQRNEISPCESEKAKK
ncbi:uncharacterized protein LOC142170329 [Nicotiana tabacum]|uniref:Uncharacterized protein LOC142170329 n=1 Tax=Nicotiana tabacum TaxID=4097 RepID=A0AC58STL1_TOBAC